MLSFTLIGWICMEWLREACNDVRWQLLYGAFLPAAACLTLRWDHRRIYFAKTEKGERTRRIDSKHNRMWYWAEFHSRTRVHTPTHYTLQYSHHRQAFKIHACGFSAFSISDFFFFFSIYHREGSPALCSPLTQVCNSSMRASTIGWDWQTRSS